MSENRERRSSEGGIIAGMEHTDLLGLDRRACYRALKTRDARFDGRLFVGITSTGIYCRPICPARSAKFENCRFFASAPAAQEAGFRPCLRCRPETAPDLGSWRGTSNTVSRGLALIAEGALEGDNASVDALADRLGVGGRQLRRLFKRFARRDDSRGRTLEGAGLGLAIVESIMKLQGGVVRARQDGGLLRFVLVFPAREIAIS